MSFQIYLSYSAIDRGNAVRIYDALANHEQFQPWLDIKALDVSQNWVIECDIALRQSHAVVALLSVNSYILRRLVQEWEWAYRQSHPIIFLSMMNIRDATERLPVHFVTLDIIDWAETSDMGIQQLIKSLERLVK